MKSCLIGYTGFVGSTLRRLRKFDAEINRANLEALYNKEFGTLICAGLPAAKWVANKEPLEDFRNMTTLIETLKGVAVEHFVLISTVDIYGEPIGCDEDSTDCLSTQPYGRHRLIFEDFIRENFPSHTIVRLPALFGNGLKKNVLFDLLNNNQVEKINASSVFQWYCVDRLAEDLDTLRSNSFSGTINLCPEPLPTRELVRSCFKDITLPEPSSPVVVYDVRSKFTAIFGRQNHYITDKNGVLNQIEAFVHSYRK
jgi:hypothetical protein